MPRSLEAKPHKGQNRENLWGNYMATQFSQDFLPLQAAYRRGWKLSMDNFQIWAFYDVVPIEGQMT